VQGHVYHWKHGWIPLTHTAAMVKAKGNRHTAAKYADHYGITDQRHRTHDRRQGGDLGPHERRKAGDERGTFQYKPGTRTRDYPQRPGTFEPEVHGGGTLHGGPRSASEAFKMKKADLEPHAKGGNPHAQAELDRRAAKRTGAPAAPKAAPKAAPDTTSPESPHFEPKPIGEYQGPTNYDGTAAARTENAERMYGTGSDTHMRAVEKENREIEGGLPAGHTISSRMVERPDGLGRGVVNAHHVNGERIGATVKAKDGGYRAKYKGAVIGTHRTREEAHKALAVHHAGQTNAVKEIDPADVEAEDARITSALPAGESVSGTVGKRYELSQHGGYNSLQAVHSTHYRKNESGGIIGERIGAVTQVGPGKFRAEHNYVPIGRKTRVRESIGDFASRHEAHQAISKAHAEHLTKKAASDTRKADAAARKAAQVGTVAGPHGSTWTPSTLDDDGTFSGKLAAAKAKQVFKANGHTVVIETGMNAEQTKGLLTDVSSAIERAHPNLKGAHVKFLVPTGDSEFRTRKDGKTVGAYVHVGGTTVHINPKVANNELAEAFARGGQTGHFMPGATKVAPREYTILHELGHVADGQHGHTSTGRFAASFAPEVKAHHSGLAHAHSNYGAANPAEGYAEAFAQHGIGGVGSHEVSDAYAKQYGWHAPGTPAHQSTPFRDSSLAAALDPDGRYSTSASPAKPLTREQEAARAKFQDDLEKRLGLGKYAGTSRIEGGEPRPGHLAPASRAGRFAKAAATPKQLPAKPTGTYVGTYVNDWKLANLRSRRAGTLAEQSAAEAEMRKIERAAAKDGYTPDWGKHDEEIRRAYLATASEGDLRKALRDPSTRSFARDELRRRGLSATVDSIAVQGPPRVSKGFSSARPKTALTASERAKPRQTGTFHHGTASRSSSNPTRRMGR
jgi:hypothetical protein